DDRAHHQHDLDHHAAVERRHALRAGRPEDRRPAGRLPVRMNDTSARAFGRRFGIAFLVAVLTTVFAIGGAYAFAARKVASVPKVDLDTSVLEGSTNYLLIGSDSRAFVDSAQDAEHFGDAQSQSGQRSDT